MTDLKSVIWGLQMQTGCWLETENLLHNLSSFEPEQAAVSEGSTVSGTGFDPVQAL